LTATTLAGNIDNLVDEVCAQSTVSPVGQDLSWSVAVVKRVIASGISNVEGCRITLPSIVDVGQFRKRLQDYWDVAVCEFLEFGWPINLEHDIQRDGDVAQRRCRLC
jgi:hypothetical protein